LTADRDGARGSFTARAPILRRTRLRTRAVETTEVLVKTLLLAGALTVIAAAALPAFAQTAATTAPAATATASEQAGGDGQGDRPWMRGHGGWGMPGGPMMRQMMMRRMMLGGNPQQRCINRLAWRAARFAYVEAKLGLTAEQRPLWDKLEGIGKSEQQKERQLCLQLKPDEEATVLDRMDRAQEFLSARLAAVQSVKPAVQALYQSLTPEQKAIFDHPFRPD
jgi:LTXXQ motif family protein